MNTMNLIVVLESSIVIYAVHMADVAHERMNSCHVITHIIMIAEHFFTGWSQLLLLWRIWLSNRYNVANENLLIRSKTP